MSRKLKLGSIALIVVAVAALLFIAASDRIYFLKTDLRSDDSVTHVESGYELYFHKDRTDLVVATAFHNVAPRQGNLTPIIFIMSPHDGYQIDSLRLEFEMFQPTSALKFDNPETGSSIPYDYTRTDYASWVVLDIPDLGAQGSENVSLIFWMDTPEIDPDFLEDLTLGIRFDMHEESLLKIATYSTDVAVNLDFPPASR
jgi:hypothetical protein